MNHHADMPSPKAREPLELTLPWTSLEAISHRDPGGRGLASFRRDKAPLDAGALRTAGLHLAAHARRVAIITGFSVALEDRVTAETDGPPGAVFLAQVFDLLGIETSIVTDCYAAPLVAAGCNLAGLSSLPIQEFPLTADPKRADDWANEFLTRGWSHLIAIERPGPSHTEQSLATQSRITPTPCDRFLNSVPPADRDVCHTMNGENIQTRTAPTHRLFDLAREDNLPTRTIAIGDGGNELGMGSFLWEDLVEAIATDAAARIACRIPADFALLAGTSNWGGYALGLAVARLRGLDPTNRWLTAAGQEEIVSAVVAAGGVDGRTRRAEATVDGLTMADYLQPLEEMTSLLVTTAG